MALDGIILQQICKALDTLIPSKINKIQSVSDTDILFTLRAHNQNYRLLVSAHSSYNRIHITERTYNTPEVPHSFIMVLRKHISGAIIKDICQQGLDRVLKITLEARDELGDIHTLYMYIELMGKYANVILVNEENRVIDALKRIPPFENSVRTIHPGAVFVPVALQSDKHNPYTSDSYDAHTSLTAQFHGFSPLLSQEVFHRLASGQSWTAITQEMKDSNSLFIYPEEEKDPFHIIALTHLPSEGQEVGLQEGMDNIYFEKEEKIHIKEQSGDLFKVVRQELKKSRSKCVKLESTLAAAYNLEQYRVYGDLLYAYAHQYPHKISVVTLPSFDGDEDITIPLNITLDIKQNAKKYYQKYQKSKTAQVEVAKQIEITLDTISYFETLEAQLALANIHDAQEIRDELSEKGYMRKKQYRIRQKKKGAPHFMTLEVDDARIFVGKNNIQNDYITWKQSRKEYTWFHAKDLHGSHVVVNQESPSESTLRMAAMLAAYYSQGRQSSSVPINYCAIKQLRKPNKAQLGFVTLTHYKTIYIDPEEAQIKAWIDTYKAK